MFEWGSNWVHVKQLANLLKMPLKGFKLSNVFIFYIFMEGDEKHYFWRLNFMRKLILIVFVAAMLPSCGKSTRYSTTVVKPKYHHRWYDRKKDRQTPRTKKLRVKS
jgi:hypothetical protein